MTENTSKVLIISMLQTAKTLIEASSKKGYSFTIVLFQEKLYLSNMKVSIQRLKRVFEIGIVLFKDNLLKRYLVTQSSRI